MCGGVIPLQPLGMKNRLHSWDINATPRTCLDKDHHAPQEIDLHASAEKKSEQRRERGKGGREEGGEGENDEPEEYKKTARPVRTAVINSRYALKVAFCCHFHHSREREKGERCPSALYYYSYTYFVLLSIFRYFGHVDYIHVSM